MAMPHSIEDEAIATEAVDPGTLIAENAALRDRLLRALAEVENTHRRTGRIAEDVRKYAIADFARELLVVVDNLQRTIAAAKGPSAVTTEGAALVEGARATSRILMQILERFGVRPIVALGQRLDPNRHEAIMETDDPSRAPGTIIRVVEGGYTINDRLLRPARVIVAKRHAGDAPALDDEPTDSEPEEFSLEHRR